MTVTTGHAICSLIMEIGRAWRGLALINASNQSCAQDCGLAESYMGT
jgi:hypothetical protein